MQIEVNGRHLEITDAIRDHALQRAEKLPRFWDAVKHVEIVIEKTGDHTFKSEIICHVDNHPHVVSVNKDADLHAALDGSAAKAERQLHDLKDKAKQHH